MAGHRESFSGEMTCEELVKDTARLVAGLQVLVSMGAHARLTMGAGFAPWERLAAAVNGGFGWFTVPRAEERYREIAGIARKEAATVPLADSAVRAALAVFYAGWEGSGGDPAYRRMAAALQAALAASQAGHEGGE
jgi:hypothetical protein